MFKTIGSLTVKKEKEEDGLKPKKNTMMFLLD
jgi:hypothetical protein